MNAERGMPKLSEPVDIAREADFRLGLALVQPSLRRVSLGERQETLEPRVMQVLIALARGNSQVISRDLLITQCWGGRIVGDDAINRCIGRLRQLSADLDKAFEIETIPRVGYRLGIAKPDATATPALTHAANSAHRLPVLLPAAVAFLFLAIMGFAFLRPAHQAQWSVVQSDVIVSTSLIEQHPAISPDGKMIAYSAGSDPVHRRILLRRLTDGSPLTLTNDSFDDSSPSWSPDGNRIAYVGFKDGEPCHLMVTSVPAGPALEVGRCNTQQASEAVWAADANAIFFVDSSDLKNANRIMRLDIDSGKTVQVDRPPVSIPDDGLPSVSPDGHWLSFDRSLDFIRFQRILFDLKSGRERVLVTYAGSNGAAWSADSRTLFVSASRGRDHALWAYSTDGGPPSRILSSPSLLAELSSGPHGLLAAEIAVGYAGLAKMPMGAHGPPQNLAPDKSRDHAPDVSADGTIVFSAERPDGNGIFALDRNGSLRKLHDLSIDAAALARPRWSPDGRYIAFTTKGANAYIVWVLTAFGAQVAANPLPVEAVGPVAWTSSESFVFPAFLPNGTRIWRPQLFRVNLAQPQKVVPLPLSGWEYVWARGSELYGARYGEDGVWRIDGKPREVVVLPSQALRENWILSGTDILYADDSTANGRRIMARPLAGGPPRVVAVVPRYQTAEGFAIDPVDKSIVYDASLSDDADIELLHLADRY
ncbi:MAG TPA: winged helix-turn-helix domain-containing protein [Rhizomicrobium sp.]|jgi:Tol biopolymer transport system component/DNA-binding winged helix-turn-helix (wHTH) protein